MNLSSYLQMPPAPSGPTSTSIPVPQGTRAGAGLPAGADSGFDFAQVMAHQMARLVPQERQTFAADVPKPPEPTPQTRSDNARYTSEDQNNTRERASRDASAAAEDADRASDTDTRQRNKHHTHKTQRAEDTDTLLESLMQGAPQMTTRKALPEAMVSVNTGSSSSLTDMGDAPHVIKGDQLQTIALSPQVHIITDPKQAPSPESLAAFAKSMGLSESEIQNLLNPSQPPATTSTPAGQSAGAPQMAPNGLQAAMNTLFQGLPQATTSGTDTVMTNAWAGVNSLETAVMPVVSGQGLAAAASTLLTPAQPGLTTADMANIQQLQITVLPAAVLPIQTPAPNTPMPSTIDMLSLFGNGIDESDVGALLSRFSQETNSGEGQADQSPSQGEDQHFSGFAQALARNTNTATTPSSAANPATATHMGDVYDQLSDKMATELAARMHKQLSDGEWKMKFGLRPSNLGGVEIQLEMKDGKLDAVFRADNPLTRDLLQNSSQRLREALGNFGINAGQVQVGQEGGQAQHQSSRNSTKQSQVRDNSSSQVNGKDSASGATSARNKAHASLLDLYA